MCATAYSSKAEGAEGGEDTRPKREEVTGGWMKQPSDGGKNESGNMKERGYFEDLVLQGRITLI